MTKKDDSSISGNCHSDTPSWYYGGVTQTPTNSPQKLTGLGWLFLDNAILNTENTEIEADILLQGILLKQTEVFTKT